MHYACIACIIIKFVMRMEKKLPLSLFRRMQIQNKEDNDVKFINAELESNSSYNFEQL